MFIFCSVSRQTPSIHHDSQLSTHASQTITSLSAVAKRNHDPFSIFTKFRITLVGLSASIYLCSTSTTTTHRAIWCTVHISWFRSCKLLLAIQDSIAHSFDALRKHQFASMTIHDVSSSSCSPSSKIFTDAIVEEEIPQQPLPPEGGFVSDQNQHQHQHLHHRLSLSPGAKNVTSPPNATTTVVNTTNANDSSAISISSSLSVDSSQTPRRKLKKKTSTDEAQSLVKSRVDKKSKSKTKMSSGTDVKKKQAEHHAVIKYGSLLLLVGQMVGLVFLMRYTRTHHSEGGSEEGGLYLASTAVFMMEVRF